MSTIPPTLPFRIQAAYGAQPSAKIQPAPSKLAKSPHMPAAAARLIAGQVQGKVAFSNSADTVELSGNSSQKSALPRDVLPMYRNPAEKNTAATAVILGRTLDAKA